MKWSKAELINQGNQELQLTSVTLIRQVGQRIVRTKNVTVTGSGHYDPDLQRFEADLKITGDMVVPCAVSLEDVIVPFETSSHEVFSFLPCEEDEVHVLKKDVLELYPVVFQLILAEVPLKVVKSGISYPKGEGWEVIREEDYNRQKKQEIDPRLAKLKESSLMIRRC
ncbi:MAG: YceD family protein [Holdemania massiliensis]